MKKLSLFTLLAAVATFLTSTVYAEGIGSANVKFGKPQDNQTECMGKGICMLESGITTHGGMLPVTFVLLMDPTAGFYTLSLQFNISLMSSADHDYLYRYFLYPDGEPRPEFYFEAPYTFENEELCRALNISPGSLTIPVGTDGEPRNIEKLNDADIRITFVIPADGAHQGK